MARPPSHLDAALAQLAASLNQVEGKAVDLLTAPWPEVEKGIIKLLQGPYVPDRPEHQLVALGLAAAFGQRLVDSDKAFWFPMRESPEGAMVGFPDAVLMLSPFTTVTDALRRAQLARLDDVAKDIRRAMAEARFAPTAGAPVRLSPADYARLFDPSFLQFLAVDKRRLEELWAARPDRLSRDFREALARAGGRIAPESRTQLEQQLVGALGRLDPSQTLGEQLTQAPRLAELLVDLFAATHRTGSAPDEFWEDAVFPLLFIGVPDSFPPLDPEEVRAAQQGADPLLLFLDTVPYRQPAPPEDGVLGVFEVGQVGLLHPGLGRTGMPRLLTVPAAPLQALLQSFDARAMADALTRFSAFLSQKAGKPVQASAPGKQMEEAALALLGEFKTLLAAAGDTTLAMRRLTEAEALSDGALGAVRQALQGPRIILAP